MNEIQNVNTNKRIYFSAADIAELLGVSKTSAYGIIRRLNDELDKKGFIVLQGKISKVYFNERWYGGAERVVTEQGA